METARSLGLREGLHFTVQTDVARRRLGAAGHAAARRRRPAGAGRREDERSPAGSRRWRPTTPEERLDALRVHVRNIRSRAAELAGKGYQRWADAIYGTIMFVPSDAAVVAALDTDPDLLRWLLDRRVFVCGPTGFAVIASAAMLAASERVLAADIERGARAGGRRAPGGGGRGRRGERVEHAPAAVPAGPAARAGRADPVRRGGGAADRGGGQPDAAAAVRRSEEFVVNGSTRRVT